MSSNVLNHVAFIMDGNGRWAKKRKKNRVYGHAKGVEVIPKIVEEAIKQKIKYVSFFAFSTENWNRPKMEVKYLLGLIEKYVKDKFIQEVNKKNIKILWIGFEEKLSTKLIESINNCTKKTENNTAITVCIFFNYSGKKDLDNAIILSKQDKENKPIKNYLLTKELPEIDLLIRTSGEERISNFALYDLAYSEIIFEPTLWPDYSKEIFKKNIVNYNNRNRRFGEVDSNEKNWNQKNRN